MIVKMHCSLELEVLISILMREKNNNKGYEEGKGRDKEII